MRAITIREPGGPDVLELRDVPVPEPAADEVLVRVHATAVNRADLLQRAGRYPAPAGVPADIPGLEYAGTVAAVGAAVERWRTGDRVMGLVGGGSYAEYIVTHADEAVSIPAGLDFAMAAAVPEAFITAHDALFTRMQLVSDETVLVHAVGSGVGTAGLQLAKAAGARVIGTQRSGWKLERAAGLGLDVALATDGTDFARPVLDATGGRGVHGVLDLVGGHYLAGNLECIATLGRIVVVGLVAGARHELDMRRLLSRRATIIGTVLRARSHEEKVAAVRAFEVHVLPLLEQGVVRPVVDEVLPLEDARRAHEVVGANQNFGKIVLSAAATG
jgi:NADPH:quinone reductase